MSFLLLPLPRSDLAVFILPFLSFPFRAHTGARRSGRLWAPRADTHPCPSAPHTQARPPQQQ